MKILAKYIFRCKLSDYFTNVFIELCLVFVMFNLAKSKWFASFERLCSYWMYQIIFIINFRFAVKMFLWDWFSGALQYLGKCFLQSKKAYDAIRVCRSVFCFCFFLYHWIYVWQVEVCTHCWPFVNQVMWFCWLSLHFHFFGSIVIIFDRVIKAMKWEYVKMTTNNDHSNNNLCCSANIYMLLVEIQQS